MKITKYPQSCFLVESLGKRFVIDPGNLVKEKMSDFNIDDWQNINAVLITHKHNDHCDPALIKQIQEKNQNVLIYTNSEVAGILQAEKIEAKAVKDGDILEFGEVKVEVVHALHGYYVKMSESGYPKENVGYIIDDGKNRLYHASDTIMFKNYPKADIILLPICGHAIVMESDVGIEFAEYVKAKLIIPCHYESPKHPLGTERFEKIVKERGVNYKVLKNGESLEL